VRHARTSRRTFYECLPDKESAFIELIRESSIAIHQLVEAGMDPEALWNEQVERAIDAYVSALTDDPVLAATVSHELPTLGRRGAAFQHEGIERFAELFVRITRWPEMRRAGVRLVTTDAAVMPDGWIGRAHCACHASGTPLADAGATTKAVIKAAISRTRPHVASRPLHNACRPATERERFELSVRQ
jgi:AcrR family transcriptional regulator